MILVVSYGKVVWQDVDMALHAGKESKYMFIDLLINLKSLTRN